MEAFGSTNEEICDLVEDQKFNEKMQIESERKSDTVSSNLSDVANFQSEESFSLSEDKNEISFSELSDQEILLDEEEDELLTMEALELPMFNLLLNIYN